MRKAKYYNVEEIFLNCGYVVLEIINYNLFKKYKLQCKLCGNVTIRKFSYKNATTKQCRSCYDLKRKENINSKESLEYKRYSDIVYRLSKQNAKKNSLVVNSGFHLDHIRSIRDCYDDLLHPKIVANIANLRVISGIENVQKSCNSLLQKEELLINIFGYLPEEKEYKIEFIPIARKFHKIETIICVETQEKFPSIREAARKLNLDSSSLAKVVNGINSTVGGFTFIRESGPPKTYKRTKKFKRKIKCLTNGIIYESITKASKELNISDSVIIDVLNKKRKFAKGFEFINID